MEKTDSAPLAGMSRLVVGGHSFIAELGNDPAIGFDEQVALVEACLDAGITSFDTTYEPERVALGRVLAGLRRRPEAQVTAWNFFADPQSNTALGPPRPYRPGDLDLLLEQLQSEHIDLLVVHPVGDPGEDARQAEVALGWQASGRVRALGTWAPGEDPAPRHGSAHPYRCMFAPRNLAHPSTAPFDAARRMGWRTFATSPFGRGWLLDRLAAAGGGEPPRLKARLADALLRFSLHHAAVDHLVVGIRNPAWIQPNLQSAAAGPLPAADLQWLHALLAGAPQPS